MLAACGAAQRPAPEKLIDLADFQELEHVKNMQGGAVYGDLLFSMQNKGWCNVFDLRTRQPIAQFPLATHGKNNHANTAFFGQQRYDESDAFPLIYISQCREKPVEEIGLPETDSLSRLLFVERILTDERGVPSGTELVQLVNYEPEKWNSRLWIADSSKPDYIYCYGNIVGNAKPGNRIVLQKFAFPEYSSGEFLVKWTKDDVLETLYFDELLPEGARGPQNAVIQGAFLRDGVLFLPCGVGNEEKPSELFYASLDGKRYGYFNYNDILPYEPEDLDLWEDKLVCPCNTDSIGVIYSFPYPELLKAMSRR